MSERDLAGWLAYIETVHHREIDMGLARVRSVMRRMHLEPLPYTVIAVAGTNGKGSCVAMLHEILSRQGYAVGAYTSPHLMRYNERIRVGRELVSDDALIQAFTAIEAARGDIPLTYFEFGTLAAHGCFRDARMEVAVMEVGMGGRLDAVNALPPDAALITNIGLDHQRWLGETRERIGREKAGILYSGHPAVYADPEPVSSVLDVARDMHVDLWMAGHDYIVGRSAAGWQWRCGDETRDYPLPALAGEHQVDNAAATISLLKRLESRLPVSRQAIETGLEKVRLPGRLQTIASCPMQIVDVAHNAEAARTLARYLEANPWPGRTHAVTAMLADKPARRIFEMLAPYVDTWWLGGLAGARGRSGPALLEVFEAAVPDGVTQVFDNVVEACRAALSAADADDRIIVFGSFYTVGDILADLQYPVV